MTTYIAVSKTSPATTFYLDAYFMGQSIEGNYSTFHVYARAINGPGGSTGSYYNGFGAHSVAIDGIGELGRHQANPFLPSGYPNGATRWNDGWAVNVPHNPDGTHGGFWFRMGLSYKDINESHVAWSGALPTIPRASNISFSNPDFEHLIIGEPVTISTNRAAASFTHDLDWYFDNQSGRALTGVGASAQWVVPATFYSFIPNSSTGVARMRTTTYNGGSYVGVSDSLFRFWVPPTAIPSWTSISVTEGNPDVATKVGAFVQGISKPSYSIVGATGFQGSTVTQQKFQIGTQTLIGASGTVSAPVEESGTVPTTFTVTDSRSQSRTEVKNITVLPYKTPLINSVTVSRALSNGTVDADEGTYLKVALNASVSSLVNGSEKNSIAFKVYTKLRTESTWTLSHTQTVSGISFNSSALVAGPFAVDKSYDVRVEVSDIFNTSAAQSIISVAAIFMHWGDGLGVNKYHENGALDVGGDGYFTGNVISTSGAFIPSATTPGIITDRVPHSGTTAERDAYYGIPTSGSPQVLLANRSPIWYNTEKGWYESYYVPVGSSGLTVRGLRTGTPAGWYPMTGSLLTATRIQSNGFQSIAAGGIYGTNLGVTLTNIGGFTFPAANQIEIPFPGIYDISAAVYYSGGGVSSYLQCVVEAGLPGTTFGLIAQAIVPGGAADAKVTTAATGVPLASGFRVALGARSAVNNNVYGDGLGRHTFLSLNYRGPHLADY